MCMYYTVLAGSNFIMLPFLEMQLQFCPLSALLLSTRSDDKGHILGSSEGFSPFCLISLLFITLYIAVMIFAFERVTLGFETLVIYGTSHQLMFMFRSLPHTDLRRNRTEGFSFHQESEVSGLQV